MSITKITKPELLDFPKDSTSSVNTSGTVIPTGVTDATSVEYLIVAGGGAAGADNDGGGGAGGVLNDTVSMTDGTTFTLTIGEGGVGIGTYPTGAAQNGDDSILTDSASLTLTAVGGGRGGQRGGADGQLGGSGGGGGAYIIGSGGTGGAGTPGQGNDGGTVNANTSPYSGAGGGGAGGAGGSGQAGAAGIGVDKSSVINSTNATSASVGEVSGSGVWFAGGGGAGSNSAGTLSGGLGGGGDGVTYPSSGGNGTANTGGGGGGAGSTAPARTNTGGSGGRGVIILRYNSTRTATTSGFTAEAGPYTEGAYKVLVLKEGTGTVVFSGSPTNVRPTTNLNAGEFRFNTTTGYVEYYNGSKWQQIADEYITGQPTTCICSYPSNTTPIALYQLDNVNETCGTWSNATNVGSATFTSGKFGDALTVNGSSQYLTLSDAWTYSNDFSCSVWVYINSLTGSYPSPISFNSSTSYDWYIELDLTGTPIINFVMPSAGPTTRVGSTGITLAINTWYHIACTTSSTDGKKFYFNGVLTDSDSGTTNLINYRTANNRIGSSSTGNDWNGKIDQLRLYNGVLTASQVTELYNEVVCN